MVATDSQSPSAEEFRTISAPVTAELVEKKSRFIAALHPVADEEEALDILATIRATERGARHNPYAYRLHDGRTRYSDDGEPAQTAGRPMLDVLVHAEITDVIGVVTRYFGGILLGTGGLVRAYSGALQLAVETAQIVTVARCVDVTLRVDYSHYETLNRLFQRKGTEVAVISVDYSDRVTMTVRVRAGAEDALLTEVAVALSATPEATVSAPALRPVSHFPRGTG